jgi:lysophospholipase L1-like esterase
MRFGTIKENTEFVEEVHGNPPWFDLSLNSGWARYTGDPPRIYSPAQIVKIGRFVNLKGLIVKETPTVGELIIPTNNLPISCAPKECKIFSNGCFGTVLDTGMFYVMNDNVTSSSRTILYVLGGTSVFYSLESNWIVEQETACFFGDSITRALGTGVTVAQRWTNQVAVSRGWREDNRGLDGNKLVSVSGDSTAGSVRYIEDVVKAYPDYIFVSFGMNDLLSAGLSGGSIIQASGFKSALNTLIINLKKYISPKRIIIQTPSLTNPSAVTPVYPNYSTVRHTAFNVATREVASVHNCKWVDTYTYMQNNGGNSLLQSDGIHPNVTGHNIIKDAMLMVV